MIVIAETLYSALHPHSETIITEDPHIQGCIMFGQGKFQNGVLIEPNPEFKFDPRDTTKLQEFRNKIWCVIVYSPRAS